jgi:hypothetical protein
VNAKTPSELLDDFLATYAVKHEIEHVERVGRERVVNWIGRLLAGAVTESKRSGPSVSLMASLDAYLQAHGLVRRANAPHNPATPAEMPSRAALERIARDQSGGKDYRPRFALLCVMAGMGRETFARWFPEFDHRRACAEIETCPQRERLALREGVEDARRLDGGKPGPKLSQDVAREMHARWLAGEAIRDLAAAFAIAPKTLTAKWSEMGLCRERPKEGGRTQCLKG